MDMQLAGFSETYLPFCRGCCYSAPWSGSAFSVTQLPRNALAVVLIMDLFNPFRQPHGSHTDSCLDETSDTFFHSEVGIWKPLPWPFQFCQNSHVLLLPNSFCCSQFTGAVTHGSNRRKGMVYQGLSSCSLWKWDEQGSFKLFYYARGQSICLLVFLRLALELCIFV